MASIPTYFENVGLILAYGRFTLNLYVFRVTGPLCGISPVTGEFPSQRPVTLSFYVFFDLGQNKRLSKQSKPRWFDMPSRSLWRNGNALSQYMYVGVRVRQSSMKDICWGKRDSS